jgi:hypothetical protein
MGWPREEEGSEDYIEVPDGRNEGGVVTRERLIT